MKIYQQLINKAKLSNTIQQSQDLQQHLYYLTLPFADIKQQAEMLFEKNPAIESFQDQPGTFFSDLLSIPQQDREDSFEQVPTKLLSAPYKTLTQEIFTSLCEEGFLQPQEKNHLIEKWGGDCLIALEIMQSQAGLGFANRLDFWKWHLSRKQGMNHLMDLLDRFSKELLEVDFPSICKQLKISIQDFKVRYLDELKKLPMAPRQKNHSDFQHHHVDVVVSHKEDLDITVTDPIPGFILHPLLTSDQEDVKQFYKPYLDEIQNFLLGIKKRKETLEKLMKKLVVLQHEFFSGSSTIPKDLDPKKIADDLGLHLSTISRCIQHKQVLCVHGIVPLKSLVSLSYTEESKTSLLLKLKQIIAKEDKLAPYSDEKLLQILKAKGSNISRRTLTKYRHELKIPDARRRFFR